MVLAIARQVGNFVGDVLSLDYFAKNGVIAG